MIPGPKSAYTAKVVFTNMLALYTNRRKYKVTNTETHSQNMCTYTYCLYTQTHKLLVMNNVTYENYRGQNLAAITPFGNTSKQKMDHHIPPGREINVPKQLVWQHWSNHSPPWSNKPKKPSKPSKPDGNLAPLNLASHVLECVLGVVSTSDINSEWFLVLLRFHTKYGEELSDMCENHRWITQMRIKANTAEKADKVTMDIRSCLA